MARTEREVEMNESPERLKVGLRSDEGLRPLCLRRVGRQGLLETGPAWDVSCFWLFLGGTVFHEDSGIGFGLVWKPARSLQPGKFRIYKEMSLTKEAHKS
ncbi:hypothetical protein AMECASPLE_028862 [Ameca splendens]|uniref:Uncharacterized protein n=1 Tax=Ameca splendens TaxID=208324 RepID=A0ABV0XUG4_9TELE